MDELDAITSSARRTGSRARRDEHDRGLHHDLSVLAAWRAHLAAARLSGAPRLLHRRGALKLLGGAGLGLVLAACDSSSSSSSSSCPSAST